MCVANATTPQKDITRPLISVKLALLYMKGVNFARLAIPTGRTITTIIAINALLPLG